MEPEQDFARLITSTYRHLDELKHLTQSPEYSYTQELLECSDKFGSMMKNTFSSSGFEAMDRQMEDLLNYIHALLEKESDRPDTSVIQRISGQLNLLHTDLTDLREALNRLH